MHVSLACLENIIPRRPTVTGANPVAVDPPLGSARCVNNPHTASYYIWESHSVAHWCPFVCLYWLSCQFQTSLERSFGVLNCFYVEKLLQVTLNVRHFLTRVAYVRVIKLIEICVSFHYKRPERSLKLKLHKASQHGFSAPRGRVPAVTCHKRPIDNIAYWILARR